MSTQNSKKIHNRQKDIVKKSSRAEEI